MSSPPKITVVGAGYVGMSIATILAQKNEVIIFDISSKKVQMIKDGLATIKDDHIESLLKQDDTNLKGTCDKNEAFSDSDYVIVATPTDYNEITNEFDTQSVDSSIREILKINNHCTIIIKSTIPVGHTDLLNSQFCTDRIIFSPEFLREGKAVFDNLFPSRIIIGSNSKEAKLFALLLKDASKKKNVETMFVSAAEAESIKLFSNTYLAMRVSFFNELDSFSLQKKLDTKNVIKGVCLDPRINDIYNNPSFGYGGYCLPKDTKQLLTNYDSVPQSLIQAIVTSNTIRKDFISQKIIELNPQVVGFYRLIMKYDSDNFRFSASNSILKRLQAAGLKVLIYEPYLYDEEYNGAKVVNELDAFKSECDIIVANRVSPNLEDVSHKCFSRDIFGKN